MSTTQLPPPLPEEDPAHTQDALARVLQVAHTLAAQRPAYLPTALALSWARAGLDRIGGPTDNSFLGYCLGCQRPCFRLEAREGSHEGECVHYCPACGGCVDESVPF